MRTYEVTIYPVTEWKVRVEAKNKKEAKEKALSMEGPSEYSFHGDDLNKWKYSIWEWPNNGNGNVDVEKV